MKFLFLFLVSSVLAATPVDFLLKDSWHKAYEGGVDGFQITEYTEGSENLNNWTHLISVVTYEGLLTSPEPLFINMIEGMRNKFAGAKVEYRILSQTEDCLVGEWRLSGAENTQDEHNWIKIFTQKEQIFTLLYTTKNMQEVELVREDWEKILKNAKLKS